MWIQLLLEVRASAIDMPVSLSAHIADRMPAATASNAERYMGAYYLYISPPSHASGARNTQIPSLIILCPNYLVGVQ
jgi:hypothetical protein